MIQRHLNEEKLLKNGKFSYQDFEKINKIINTNLYNIYK